MNKQDYFTKKELESLKDRLGHDRDSLLIKLALVTGARESELVLLTKASLDIDACTVLITATKGSNDRIIHISRDLMCSLQQIETDRLFPISTSRIRQIWYRIRPSTLQKRFHCFRHTFGVELYKASRDIMFVKQAMGHKSISSTMVYVQCVDYDEQFTKTHNALASLLV